MSTPPFAYPFDPTGLLASNLIVNERHTLSAPEHTQFFFIIPLAGPFFRTGHKLIHHPSGRELVEGVDYALTHRFHDASLACGKPIYGSFSLYDHSMLGVVELRYQSVGGPWTLSQEKITEILSNNITNPRITTWEMVADLPHEFPVVDHPWELTDLVGASQLVASVNAVEDAIRDAASGAADEHVNDKNNPHEVTKAQVGLANVQNFPVSTTVEATGGTSNAAYMTPLRTREAILGLVANDYFAHKANTANPHNTTKVHVGLSLVANYAPATPADVVAGTAADLYVTPVGVKAATDAALSGVITPHITNKNNPHEVSKAQVGLGSVENLPLATTPQAIAATSNAFYMTPVRTRELVDALFGQTLINHVNDRTNPHDVDKAQVGLSNVPNLGLATTAAAQAGLDDSGLMTPRLVYEAIISLGSGGGGGGGSGIDTLHRADLNNPHATTAEQVGAYDKAAADAKFAGKLNVNATAANANLLEGRSLDDVLHLARARYDWPAVVSQDIDDGSGGTITINDKTTWTALGNFIPVTVIDDEHPVGDMVCEFTGGDKRNANQIPIFKVKLNLYPSPKLEVEQTAGAVSETRFGYVRDAGTGAVTLYVRSTPERNPFSVLVGADPSNGFGLTQAPLDNEPLGIVYEDSFVYMGGSPNVDANVGDILFAKNPYFEDAPDFGQIVEFVNVARGEEKVLAARLTNNHIADEYPEFIPASAWADKSRNAVKTDLSGWKWRTPLLSMVHEPVSTSLTMLLSCNAYTSYSFEFELHSPDSMGGAIGVCAAFVRKNGKDYGIYAYRHPGGLSAAVLPGGNFQRKRFTVGYNLLQDDAIDLGSTDFDTPDGATWPLAGRCRMKVTRLGNVIYIQTTEFGSTDFEAASHTVTIDLNSRPELAVFKAPTMWGFAKYDQTKAAFKIINRPDANVPYIDVAYDSDGNDISTINRYNGLQWVSQPMTLQSGFIKPGRLYYSELTLRFFVARRDGTLRMLAMEPYTRESVTVLTE